MPKLTPEQQNAQMSVERKVLTSLLEAAVSGDFSSVRSTAVDYTLVHTELTVADVLSQFKDAQKRTVLHFACQSKETRGSKDIVEEILEWLATLNLDSKRISGLLHLKDKEGLTPIMLAAQCAHQETAEKRVVCLLRSDRTLGLARSKTGATALHYAAANGASPATITALATAAKASVQAFSKSGGTALHWACAVPPPTDHTDIISSLLEAGADVNANNESCPPALAMSMAAGNDKHAKFILQQSNCEVQASVDFVLQPGKVSMYHMAADMNMPGTLALLLEHCQNVSEMLDNRNDQGCTVLDLAAKEKNVGCVMVLLGASNAGVTEQDATDYVAKWKPGSTIETKKEIALSPKPASDVDESSGEKMAKEHAASLATRTVSDEDKKKALEHKSTGNTLFAKKEWTQAIVEYSHAIDKDPTDATFYSNRSACYMATNNANKALYDAVVCRCLRQEWPKAAYRMAVARLALERHEDAAVSAWEGLSQDPENDELKSLLQKCVKRGRKVHQSTGTKA